ncbi:Gfo/Idh/MocA family protein [candidate division KSB1 bacterium]
MAEPINIAIVGAGIAARELHLPVYRKLTKQFRVKLVCGRTLDKAQTLAAEFGCDATTDYDEVLGIPEIEAVDLCLPIELNHDYALGAAEAGKNILCEKPIGAGIDEAAAMVSIPARFGIRMMVAENYRYRPTFIRAKKLIDDGVIGRPHLLIHNHLSGRVDSPTAWRRTHKYPGGFLLDGGVHYVNALRLMGGEIRSVKANVNSANPILGRVDTAVVALEFASGALGSLVMGYAAHPISGPTYLACGFLGTLAISDGKIELFAGRERKKIWRFKDDYGFTAQFRDFYRLVRHGKATKLTLEDTRRDALTILAALESGEKGGEIKLDFG